MQTFFQIDSDGLLTQAIQVDDSDCLDGNDNFSKSIGSKYCQSLLGGEWVCFIEKENPFVYPAVGMFYLNGNLYKDKENIGISPKPTTFLNLPNKTSYLVLLRNATSLFTNLISQTYFGGARRQDLPYSNTPIGDIHAIVRNPIDRFVSSYALNLCSIQDKMTQDEFIDWLINQNPSSLDRHFKPQTTTIGDTNGVIYHDFSKDLNPLATIFGLETPLPVVNSTNPSTKPVLTDEQITKLQAYYASDVDLYNQVKSN